ncbi:VRR-NUC domain-containing protein [Daedaleopsis nitida]|nr:VRR-NUC domain-containing protein [Daedaleopsis nitida]
MPLGSPSTSTAARLVYESGVVEDNSGRASFDDSVVEEINAVDGERSDPNQPRTSMYVTLFEDMLGEILQVEARLFTEDELKVLWAWYKLPSSAKYLFCRLMLRKDTWIRLDQLKYQAEIGQEGILKAIETLCSPIQTVEPGVKVKVEDDNSFPDKAPSKKLFGILKTEPKPEPSEPTNPSSPTLPQAQAPLLPCSSGDGDDQQPESGPSRSSPVLEPSPPPSSSIPSSTPDSPDYSVFAHCEEEATTLELLECCDVKLLEELAKMLKLKPNSKKRDVLIESILRGSATQSTLQFPKVSRKGKEPMVQTKLNFKPTPQTLETQQGRVRAIVLKTLKKCIRLNPHVVALFHRASLVYFRHTQYTPELLTPAILARARKRKYANYVCKRTPDIWRTREDLLAYEDALAREAEVDALLEASGVSGRKAGRYRSVASRTPAPSGGPNRNKTPVTPGKGHAAKSPVDDKGSVTGEPEEGQRVKNARQVVEILDEVFPIWSDLVAAKVEIDPPRKGLERFDCGHIWTRVVCKGAYALGILKQYEREVTVLKALLAQTRWRRGRRGRWYERSALVLMTHLKNQEGCSEEAMDIVICALEDPDTHIVYRPMLQRRLTTLEARLKIPPEEQHVCEATLKAATNVYVEGVRIHHRAGSLKLDDTLRSKNQPLPMAQVLSWSNRVVPPIKVKQEDKAVKGKKSIWYGRDNQEVSVEEFALQWYQDQHGCKGFHCEGRIVTTLFGLLFWDIIFAPIPGAFETPFQSAPLDLAEDTFYHSRREHADARLEEIKEGRAAEIIEQTYDKHKDVICVGVRWDLFTKEDLVGIAKCLLPKSLMAICQLMCEDYAGRTAGVPDLIIWHEEERWAKFVEVKGPGDSLQENQKVWIDVLLMSGMPVDLCNIYEQGDPPPKAKRAAKTPKKENAKSGKTASPKKRKRDERVVESEDEDEQDYSQLDRHTEDEVEAEAVAVAALGAPTHKKRKTRADAPAPIFVSDDTEPESESPTKRKVVRVRSQLEVVITSTPPSRNPSWSVSPGKRKRSDGD